MRAAAVAFVLLLAASFGAVAAPGAETAPAGDVVIDKAIRDAANLSNAEAQKLEDGLRQTPDDLRSRALLLSYYAGNGLRDLVPDAARAERLRHILWVIDNRPASAVAGSWYAQVGPIGGRLADPGGYDKASAAWRRQVAAHGNDRAVLRNAFAFALLPDKPWAERLARQLDAAKDPVVPLLLANLYSLGAFRIAAVNRNGLAMALDSSPEAEAFARHAVSELASSTKPEVTLVAVHELLMYGGVATMLGVPREQVLAVAEQVLAPAERRSPGNPALAAARGDVEKMRSRMATTPEERAAAAGNALAALERSAPMTTEPPAVTARNAPVPTTAEQVADARQYEYADRAKLALQAGDHDKARRYGEQLVAIAESYPNDTRFGPALHDGHVVLGVVVLHKGDVAGAKAHLRAAGATPGGGTLTSFGPNMSLAQALLAKGERKAVVEYLRSCKRFWKSELPDRWIAAIEAGQAPNFGANLSY